MKKTKKNLEQFLEEKKRLDKKITRINEIIEQKELRKEQKEKKREYEPVEYANLCNRIFRHSDREDLPREARFGYGMDVFTYRSIVNKSIDELDFRYETTCIKRKHGDQTTYKNSQVSEYHKCKVNFSGKLVLSAFGCKDYFIPFWAEPQPGEFDFSLEDIEKYSSKGRKWKKILKEM